MLSQENSRLNLMALAAETNLKCHSVTKKHNEKQNIFSELRSKIP